MKFSTKIKYSIAIFFIITKSIAQNVGIDNPLPLDKLDVNGTIRSKGLRILNNNVLEMGFGVSPKEESAGKIGYGIFTAQTLDIVGAGTAYNNRKLRFWAEGGSAFEGGATFLNKVGIGLINPNYKLHLHESNANTSINFQMTNADAGNTVNDGLHIGLNQNGAIFGLAASIINKENSSLFLGSNNAVNLTINESGNVGIGTFNPKIKLHVSGANNTKLFSVRNADTELDNRDLFAVSPQGVNIVSHGTGLSEGTIPRPGTTLINTNKETQLGKWGFDNTGAEMMSGNQTINFATETRLNFNNTQFHHKNDEMGPAFFVSLADEALDQFNVAVEGVYFIDFQINWISGDLRNARIIIKVNGATRREFISSQFNREHCFIKCEANDYITVEVYHENCFDPPPFCITGVSRQIAFSRVTVMKF